MLTLRSDLEEKLALDIGNSFTCSVYRLCKTIVELNAGFPPPKLRHTLSTAHGAQALRIMTSARKTCFVAMCFELSLVS
jgi:hypothetical protein